MSAYFYDEKYSIENHPEHYLAGVIAGTEVFDGQKAKGRISDPADRIGAQRMGYHRSLELSEVFDANYPEANAICLGARAAISKAFEDEGGVAI